ncbi:Ni/Fe-hydrogenase 2 integral membrane subunit HybB [Thermodesulfobium acidiphilum]|uniref:Ni/Fe-hydrogenase 2 integral membrane subunit HybB n=1 Tax=Thermodesulfobium acidiphilum TaxID=1794699 RepID=A0A2R4VZ56_THEAF|nr:NrfD/PsrC family molybdoenzyme membrane anchor subunit [Thermodesulfobium acidiphilum]AWB09744.1 Ni/Fe-hydrogenase 2 integral membrane subunit HybB [Thermodesulfobium acidiphilum]
MLGGQFLETAVWGLPIVIYPFLSGLMAGAFVIDSLAHLFGFKQFEPVAKLAATSSFAMVLIAALAPLVDSLQPAKAPLELYFRDHFPYSPLSVFIIIWTLYVILMFFEMYFDYRVENIEKSKLSGIRGSIARFLTFGNNNISKESLLKDRKALFIISVIGVPLAFAFHGYIGFVFGAIKARALWTSSVMMLMFITSAIVSGAALVTLLYVIGYSYYSKKNVVNIETLNALGIFMIFAIAFDLFLDFIDKLYSFRAYTEADVFHGWTLVYNAGGVLFFNYFVVQILLGLIIPLILLIFKPVRTSKLMMVIISIFVQVGVFAMRFNTVIGGQLLPKISQGTIIPEFPWLGFDGILSSIGLICLSIVIFFILGWLFGWEDSNKNGFENQTNSVDN